MKRISAMLEYFKISKWKIPSKRKNILNNTKRNSQPTDSTFLLRSSHKSLHTSDKSEVGDKFSLAEEYWPRIDGIIYKILSNTVKNWKIQVPLNTVHWYQSDRIIITCHPISLLSPNHLFNVCISLKLSTPSFYTNLRNFQITLYEQTITINQKGYAKFTNIPPGKYSLRITYNPQV